jgi:DNA-directed RNA polymerase subunit M/transcription elongation factor TFIIS
MDKIWRTKAREVLAKTVPDRPYAKNIEKQVYNWTIETFKDSFPMKRKKNIDDPEPENPISWDNRQFRMWYWSKITNLNTELKRTNELKVSVNLKVTGDDTVKLEMSFIPQLVYRMINLKEIKSTDLTSLTPDQLWPDGPYSRQLYANKTKELARDNSKRNEEGYEGMFKCRKCQGKKIHYYQLQTRSADEPMTTYFTCMTCGQKWKG